jgi:hypothetical protein
MAGLAPPDGPTVQAAIGARARQIILLVAQVHRDETGWLAGVDLTQPPYNLSAADQALLKSAIATADKTLQSMDLTFLDQVAGLF